MRPLVTELTGSSRLRGLWMPAWQPVEFATQFPAGSRQSRFVPISYSLPIPSSSACPSWSTLAPPHTRLDLSEASVVGWLVADKRVRLDE